MICSNCGKEFPDGQNFCTNCGTPAQAMNQQMNQAPMGQPMQQMNQAPMGQPMQQMNQAPMGQPMQQMNQAPMGQPMQQMNQAPMGQPMQQMGQVPMGQPMYQQAPVQPIMNKQRSSNGIGEYFASLPSQPLKIVSLVGALFILISPFLSWAKVTVSFFGTKVSESGNMFDMEKASFVIFAIWLLLTGLFFIAWELADAIPAIDNIKQKISVVPFVELIVLGVALLFVILAIVNGDINDMIKEAKEYGSGSHGVGPIFAILGIIACAVPSVMNKVNNK